MSLKKAETNSNRPILTELETRQSWQCYNIEIKHSRMYCVFHIYF